MRKIILILLVLSSSFINGYAQTITWQGKDFEIENVKASVVMVEGSNVLRVERDLNKLPFDTNNLSKTVDEPTFVKLKNLQLDSGVIEVKMLSQIVNPSPFAQAQGFIGVAFRVNENNSAYECIYLRPKAGRADNQFARNHSVQYYAYPHFKFDRLRQEEFKGQYETYADIGLNEWITLRIEFANKTAKLFLNSQQHPAFIVNDLKGSTETGSIGLWVDIGTIGYFKDLKVIQY